ncbi:MAG: capsule assembly Wzi family protein [Prevotella sp.]|nr:capsule assembly Wzi family protein [Prevotella sp.]
MKLHIRRFILLVFFMPGIAFARHKENLSANLEIAAEAQGSLSDGVTPLWLNANKYGLSSLEETNGYLRVSALRPAERDDARRWRWGYGVDVAVAGNYTSTLVVQQAYAELAWGHGLLSVGSKEEPVELKNNRLSSGSQTLGNNARPVPQVRLSLPDYWTIPGLKRWVHVKAHIAYGRFTDDRWQRHFTKEARQTALDEGKNKDLRRGRYCTDVLYHSKAVYLKIGNENKCLRHFSLELGAEMACQFGGTIHYVNSSGNLTTLKNPTGISSYIHALTSGGQDVTDGTYPNEEGNHLGQAMARLNYDDDACGVSLYFDHFFEDLSGMILLDYDGYGEGDDWNTHVEHKYYRFPLKDFMVGAELRLKYTNVVKNIVFEYLITKFQSGPYNHDRTQNISDHLAGADDYYNHSMYNSWQHWGQVMGNPLYLSPIYNEDGLILVANNRFKALHLGFDGSPFKHLDYRFLASWQAGWGTYSYPYTKRKTEFSAMLEASYSFKNDWQCTAAVGLDRGEIRGNNVGFQLSVSKVLWRGAGYKSSKKQ